MGLVPASRFEVTVAPGPLPFATDNAAAIAETWAEESAANPALFNGDIFAAVDLQDRGQGVFAVTCRQARYDMLLHWRRLGRPVSGFRILFGTAVLRAADGALVLGEMADTTAQAGKVSFPAGAFDQSDRMGNRVDVDGNIRREFAEETGLDARSVAFHAGYRLWTSDAEVAAAQIVDLPWPAEEARARMLAATGRQTNPEFCDFHIARQVADVRALNTADEVIALAEWVLTDD
jgi:8-oxo-dGTP pyrophosphatase MutT (NUDIX family)